MEQPAEALAPCRRRRRLLPRACSRSAARQAAAIPRHPEPARFPQDLKRALTQPSRVWAGPLPLPDLLPDLLPRPPPPGLLPCRSGCMAARSSPSWWRWLCPSSAGCASTRSPSPPATWRRPRARRRCGAAGSAGSAAFALLPCWPRYARCLRGGGRGGQLLCCRERHDSHRRRAETRRRAKQRQSPPRAVPRAGLSALAGGLLV